MVQRSDILLMYSGGKDNESPNRSLGGNISRFRAPSDTLNNLFDVKPETIPRGAPVSGHAPSGTSVEYRALYVKNNSLTGTFYDAHVWIEDQVPGGADVLIGIPRTNDEQNIAISPASEITGGVFSLKFGTQSTADIAWGTIGVVSDNIEVALESLDGLSVVTVDESVLPGDIWNFAISFVGGDGNKLQPNLQTFLNLLTFTGSTPDITVTSVADGRPINDIAVDIAFGNNAPVDISFEEPTVDSPIVIGHLAPQENFYIWIERTLVAPSIPEQDDETFTLKIGGGTAPGLTNIGVVGLSGYDSGYDSGFG